MKPIIETFGKTRKSLINMKLWMQRTMSWIALINSAMILFLVLSRFQDYGISIYITRWIIPIYIIVVLLMMLFGYIEDKVGFYRVESMENAKRNPYFKEILERLDRIEKKIKK